VLDDLGHSVYARGIGDRLHEGIAPLLLVDYLENILVPMYGVSGVGGAQVLSAI
jgi:hypothetical protein